MSSYPLSRRQACAAALAGLVLPLHAAAPLALRFRDTEYVHRWSRQGQHEFTPPGDTDLARWNDMLTLNLHTGVAQGEQLAGVANQVLADAFEAPHGTVACGAPDRGGSRHARTAGGSLRALPAARRHGAGHGRVTPHPWAGRRSGDEQLAAGPRCGHRAGADGVEPSAAASAAAASRCRLNAAGRTHDLTECIFVRFRTCSADLLLVVHLGNSRCCCYSFLPRIHPVAILTSRRCHGD
jgi:hypothetical protein